MKQLCIIIILLCTCINATTQKEITTNPGDLMLHFYYIRRLTKSTCFFSLLDKKNYHYKPCNIFTCPEFIQIDSICFFHHTITACIKKMMHSASLKPLLSLLRALKYYHHIDDKKFTH